MGEYGYRPPYVWYVPKPVNDIDRIIDAFKILAKEFAGKNWRENQEKFSERVEESIIKAGHGGSMAGRNWFAIFKYLGFAYTSKIGNKIVITDVGNLILKNNKREKDIVTDQLLKLQYPNPYQSKFVKETKLFPFRVLLKILFELPDNKISREEFGLFVMGLKHCVEEDIKGIVRNIIKYRNSKPHKKRVIRNSIISNYAKDVIKNFKDKGKKWRSVTPERVWTIIYDYALRHFLTIEYTDFCTYNKKNNELYLEKSKLLSIRRLLKENTLKVRHSFEDEYEWFYYYGSAVPIAKVEKTKALSRKRYRINRMLSEAEASYEKDRKIHIRTLSEKYGFSEKEIIKELQSVGLLDEKQEEKGHTRIIMKLVSLCKKEKLLAHIGKPEQGKYRKFKELSLLPMEENHFGIPDSVFKELRYIDVVWGKSDVIVKVFEVEESEIDTELRKFSNLILTSKVPIEFYLVVPDKKLKTATKRINLPFYVKNKINKKVKILTYSQVMKGKIK